MRDILYFLVGLVAKVHGFILSLNDQYEYNFSDKELHFIVIGIIGMALIFVIYPLFKWLAKSDLIMTITWIYVITLILVLTFAIEIGQKITNTGYMDFADIVFGVLGFVLFFAIFAIVRGIYHLIVNAIKERNVNNEDIAP